MTYQVTKTYGHELGLSCVFRQHRANSHCKQLHGYALAFDIVFETETLDARNWVIDFGSLKEVKEWLVDMFDHTLLVASDDPMFEELARLANSG
jgi:6-pyruvoyltetrahydropterin/6-carboxytetrahydropterin synthase